MSTAYGVTPIVAGTDTRVTVTNVNISCVIVANESPYSLLCKIDGTGSGKWIHALTIDRIDVPSMGFTGNLIFTPTTVLSNTANAPSYAMIVETYGINEEPPGVYPVSLTRSVNVGNAVTTNVTNSTLIFDGAVAGTQFIESKPSGDTNSTVTLDNSANLVLGDAAHAGSITLKGILSTDNGTFLTDGSGGLTAVKLTISGLTTLNGNFIANSGMTVNNGTFTVNPPATFNGTFNISGGILNLNGNDILDASGLNTSLFGTTGNNIQFKIGSTTKMTVDGSNVTINGGFVAQNGGTIQGNSLNFLQGSIRRTTHGSFSTNNTTNQNVAHGMSTDTPDEVIVWCAGSTSTTTASVVSIGSVNFVVSSFVAGVSMHFEARKY